MTMRTDTRRVTALVLCLALIFSLFPVFQPTQTAQAETQTTYPDWPTTYSNTADVMASVGIHANGTSTPYSGWAGLGLLSSSTLGTLMTRNGSATGTKLNQSDSLLTFGDISGWTPNGSGYPTAGSPLDFTTSSSYTFAILPTGSTQIDVNGYTPGEPDKVELIYSFTKVGGMPLNVVYDNQFGYQMDLAATPGYGNTYVTCTVQLKINDAVINTYTTPAGTGQTSPGLMWLNFGTGASYPTKYYVYIAGTCWSALSLTTPNFATNTWMTTGWAQFNGTYHSHWNTIGLGNLFTYRTRTSAATAYKPVVTAPNLVRNVGDAVPGSGTPTSGKEFTEGVTATWGYTTSKTFGWNSETYGAITNVSPTTGTTLNNALPNDGTNVTGIGMVPTQNLQAKDNSGSTTAANDVQTATRSIVFQTTTTPNLTATYNTGAVDPYTGNPIAGIDPYTAANITAANNYSGHWTNQPVVVKQSTDIIGNYKNGLFEGASAPATGTAPTVATTATYTSAGPNTAATDVSKTYSTNTAATGTTVRGRLVWNGTTPSTAVNYPLSPLSGPVDVKIDVTAPTAAYNLNSSTGAFTDATTDALSGADTTNNRGKILIVEDPTGTDSYTGFNGGVAPVVGTIAGSTATAGIYGTSGGINDTRWENYSTAAYPYAGTFDIYVLGWDNAGNAQIRKQSDNLTLKAPQKVPIRGFAWDDFTNTWSIVPLPSGTWTNTDVLVEAYYDGAAPSGTSPAGNYWEGLFESASGSPSYAGAAANSKAKSGGADTDHFAVTSNDFTLSKYTDPTAGTNVYSVALDSADNETSVLNQYVVKIDKVLPIAATTLNADFTTFTDASYDTGAVQSGIATGSAAPKVAVVPTGEATPTVMSYVLTPAAQIPAGSGYYDVWVLANDIAGNTSLPVKAYTHVNRSGLDEIDAMSFKRGIDEGTLSQADAKELAVAEGVFFNGGAVPFSQMLVDTAELSAINSAISAGIKGSFPLTFRTPATNPYYAGSTQAAVTVTVIVTGHGDVDTQTVPDKTDNSMRIYGNDFIYGVDRGAIVADAARSLAAVSLYDSDNATMSATLAAVDATELAAINAAIAAGDVSHNTWPLTFTAPDGTDVTVAVTLKQKGDTNSNP
ncbi:MAG: hypothetical protein LBS17_01175, partial [Actinomycetes bacterium]|nr:hypothetical protein [Actinomycetes bacterium]